jgi:hypothetical protein
MVQGIHTARKYRYRKILSEDDVYKTRNDDVTKSGCFGGARRVARIVQRINAYKTCAQILVK